MTRQEIHHPIEQVEQAVTPTILPPVGSMRMYPKADGEYYKLDDLGVETPFASGGGDQHEEFLPLAGATTVTLVGIPTHLTLVARAGVVQSAADGNYTLANQTITFPGPFLGTERVVVEYAVRETPLPPPPVQNAELAGYPWGNSDLKPDTARANLLANGGFEVWQRGGTFDNFVGLSAWFADKWVVAIGTGCTFPVLRQDTQNRDVGSQYCAGVSYAHGTSESYIYNFGIEHSEFRGRTLSFSIRVASNTANAIRAFFQVDGVNVAYGAFHSGSGLYETLFVTWSVPDTAASVVVGVQFAATTTGTYLDNAMLVVGDVPAQYAPLHPADDLARCQRYYEATIGVGLHVRQWVSVAGAATDSVWSPYKVQKAVTPVVTRTGAWQVSVEVPAPPNPGCPTVGNATVAGYYLSAGATAAGNPWYQTGDAGSAGGVISEANP